MTKDNQINFLLIRTLNDEPEFFSPKKNCSWLKPNGMFVIGPQHWTHTDYIRNNAAHIKCMEKPDCGDSDSNALIEFMLQTNWIQCASCPTIPQTVFFQVQPFTKDQRNAIKDLEIEGHNCIIEKRASE